MVKRLHSSPVKRGETEPIRLLLTKRCKMEQSRLLLKLKLKKNYDDCRAETLFQRGSREYLQQMDGAEACSGTWNGWPEWIASKLIDLHVLV